MAPYRVLIAEDSPTIREVLAFLLGDGGYEVREAGDGVAAVQEVLREAPDLVLLDVEMPRMNGYQVCRLLKADPALAGIPVVMLTSRDRPLDRTWGLSTGADAYLVKAMDAEEPFGELQAVMERCLGGRPPRAATGGPVVSDDEVLARLNGLLDRRLFQVTLRGRVSELARSLQSLDETVASILGLVGEVSGYASAGLLLARQGGEPLLWMGGGAALGPDGRNRLASEALAALVLAGVPQAAGWTPGRRDVALAGATPGPAGRHEAFPLRVRQATLGVLVLGLVGAGPLDPGVAENLELLVDQAALVLDNAGLYAGLDQANRDLRRTLDELTSTQVRLAETEQKVHELQIQIDQREKVERVSEIVESDYFQSLKDRVKTIRGGS